MSQLILCGAAGFMMLSLAGASADGQTIKQETARRVPSMQGPDTYKAYCAACHGPEGKGNGPAATALKKAPADLTTIAKRNGGTFSASDVEAVIMGQQVLASHGSRDMPIWGPIFQALATDNSFAKLQVSNLVGYLKSIQAK
jgi:mono/diheme cytochrome c family protein